MDERKFEEALPVLKKALTEPHLDYSKSSILTAIGNCYTEFEDYDEAIKFHDMALAGDPKNHRAHVNKGIVYRLKGEYESAANCYLEALKLAPDYAELHASMGALSLFQNDVEGSIRHLEKAVELDDTIAVCHANLAIAYAHARRFDEADVEAQKAIAQGYHQPDALNDRVEELRDLAKDDSE